MDEFGLINALASPSRRDMLKGMGTAIGTAALPGAAPIAPAASEALMPYGLAYRTLRANVLNAIPYEQQSVGVIDALSDMEKFLGPKFDASGAFRQISPAEVSAGTNRAFREIIARAALKKEGKIPEDRAIPKTQPAEPAPIQQATVNEGSKSKLPITKSKLPITAGTAAGFGAALYPTAAQGGDSNIRPVLAPKQASGLSPEQSKIVLGLMEPFGALGRAMTGQTESVPQELGAAMLGMAGPKGMGGPGKSELEQALAKIVKALGNEAPQVKPLYLASPKEQLTHFYTNNPAGKAEDALKWFKDNFHVDSSGNAALSPMGSAISKSHVKEFYGDKMKDYELEQQPFIFDEDKNILAKNPGASIFDVAGVKPPHDPNPIPSWNDYEQERIERAIPKIEPSNWAKQFPASGQYQNTQPMVPNAPLSRLEDLGFNTKLPLFKGYSQRGMAEATHYDPTKFNEHERALFFADDPNVASQYSTYGQGTYFARPQNPMELNWRSLAKSAGYDSTHMRAAIEAARQKGADFLTIKDMEDIGSNDLQNQYLMLTNPERFRRAPAKFDPSKVNLNNLLATGAVGTAGALSAPGLIQGLGNQQ